MANFLDKAGLEKVINWIKSGFVRVESGKGLSTNDLTDEMVTKLGTIEEGADDNVIESIKLNGVELAVDSSTKSVDINTVTETKVNELISAAGNLKREIVSELPTTGEDHKIYMILKTTGKDKNKYDEYMWIEGEMELIGDTATIPAESIPETEIDALLV